MTGAIVKSDGRSVGGCICERDDVARNSFQHRRLAIRVENDGSGEGATHIEKNRATLRREGGIGCINLCAYVLTRKI